MMDVFEAVSVLNEGAEDPLEAAVAMQSLINSGEAWLLEGSLGRAAMNMIESGACMLGKEARSDYWGNLVPSRDQVAEGTKGSKSFVAAYSGDDHLAALEALD